MKPNACVVNCSVHLEGLVTALTLARNQTLKIMTGLTKAKSKLKQFQCVKNLADVNSESGQMEWMTIILSGYLTFLLVLVGLCANLRLLSMLSTHKTNSFYTYLSALAVSDCVLLVFTLGYYPLNILLAHWQQPLPIPKPIVLVSMLASRFGLVCTVWLSVLLAYARYHAVLKPLQHRASMVRAHAQMCCVVLCLCAMLYTAPAVFEITIRTCVSLAKTRRQVSQSELRQVPAYLFVYHVVCEWVFISVLPLVLLILFSYFMLKSLRQPDNKLTEHVNMSACHQFRTNHVSRQSERKITRMVVFIIIKFILTHFLSIVLNVLEFVYSLASAPQAKEAVWFMHLVEVSKFLVVLHSCTNVLMYVRGLGRLPRHAPPQASASDQASGLHLHLRPMQPANRSI